MPVLKLRAKEAYVHQDDGRCVVYAFPSQKPICSSKHLRRATRRAQVLGYDVTVYCEGPQAVPRDAARVTWGSYVLRAARKRSHRAG
jgi:hypothetical protein